MSLDAVAPLDGLRVSLTLVRGDAATATFDCTFLWTDKDEGGSARARTATASALVTVTPQDVEFLDVQGVPADALTFARGLLRNMARSIGEQTKWPRRITRWRDK